MSKEIDPIEALDKLLEGYSKGMAGRSYYDIVREALQRLEAIDNAIPSKALECLEKLFNEYKELCMDIGSNEHIYQECNLTSPYNTIKRYILKEQEQKKYLKWKDLDFGYGYETKVLKVRMNDAIYKIFYRFFDNTDEAQLLSEDEKSVYSVFAGKSTDNIKLFNDLHLEVLDSE